MKNKAEEYNSKLMDEIFDSISLKEEKRIKYKMLLAAKIEDAMIAKGWNKKKLLEATGQKNASVATKWLSGTHNFTFDLLFDIQEALGINLLNLSESSFDVVAKYHFVVQSTPTSVKIKDYKNSQERKTKTSILKNSDKLSSFNIITRA
jgi:transcriptional regulator with XRE-family HTH domain